MLEAAAAEQAKVLVADQVAMGVHDVGIEEHRVGLDALLARLVRCRWAAAECSRIAARGNAEGADALLADDAADRIGAVAELHTEAAGEPLHGEWRLVHAPLRMPGTELRLDVRNRKECAGHALRRAAEVDRLVAHHVANALVVEGAVDATAIRRGGIEANPREPRHRRQQAERTEGLTEEGLIKFAPELLAAAHEGGDARSVARIERTEACGELGKVARCFEDAAVGEEGARRRLDFKEREIVAALRASGAPELIEEFWQGEDRGAAIPAIRADLAAAHLAAGARAALNNGDVHPLCGEANGGGESGEAGANNNDALRRNAHRRCRTARPTETPRAIAVPAIAKSPAGIAASTLTLSKTIMVIDAPRATLAMRKRR